MRPDFDKYPEIPRDCLVNLKANGEADQVYRNIRVIDPKTGKSRPGRESVGSIRNGVFHFSSNYLLRQRNQELTDRLERADDVKGSVHTEKVKQRLKDAIDASGLKRRNPDRIVIPLEVIVLGSLLSALTGRSDCHEISEAVNHRLSRFLAQSFPELSDIRVSHDTVRNTMMLVGTESLADFYAEIISPLLTVPGDRIIAADGQSVRATGHRDKDKNKNKENLHGAYMLMNFHDVTNRVCLYHQLNGQKNGQKNEQKKNRISVGPGCLERLNLTGATVTADAMSCQVNFARAVLKRGAHYCLALRGNQDRSWDEVRYLFNSTDESRFFSCHEGPECAHGRIEEQTVQILKGSMLSAELLRKWDALKGGSVVRVERKVVEKATGKDSIEHIEHKYYITSIPATAETVGRIAEVIRAHWGIENNLHWQLDVNFSQDRMQANNPHYITNRSALNKLALALLENYGYWLWDTKREKNVLPLKQLQSRCMDPLIAMECIACGFGFV